MKNFFLIIIILFFKVCFSQNYKITYDLEDTNATLLIVGNYAVFNKFNNPNFSYFHDIKNNQHFLYQTKMPLIGLKEDFLIDVSNPLEWKLTKETKNILGYKCNKAIAIIKNSKHSYTVTAWYTQQIKFKVGPNGKFGLPGLILEISSKEQKQINSIAVKMETIKTVNPIKYPTQKKIQLKDFIKLVKDKLGIDY